MSRLSRAQLALRAVGYTRVSTEDQAREGVSLGMQRSRIEAYCQMRGLELVDIIEDPAVSAGTPLDDREGGSELLDLVRDRKVGAVVAWQLDRLFRNARDCLAVTEEWEHRGVSFHLVDLNGATLDTSTATGKLFLTITAGFAEFERNIIGERTRAAMARKRELGERTSLDAPYGYAVVPGRAKLEPVKEELGVIEEIVIMRRRGETIKSVTAYLNSTGAMCRGVRWHPTTIARIIRREKARIEAQGLEE